jgi:hypothetical protein
VKREWRALAGTQGQGQVSAAGVGRPAGVDVVAPTGVQRASSAGPASNCVLTRRSATWSTSGLSDAKNGNPTRHARPFFHSACTYCRYHRSLSRR